MQPKVAKLKTKLGRATTDIYFKIALENLEGRKNEY